MSFSSGPYKSKLFNAINHRVRRWGDRLEVTFRQLQGAAQWGLQLLLYPIYLLVQGKGHEQPVLENHFRPQTRSPQQRLSAIAWNRPNAQLRPLNCR
ncbi:MAG: hypothetical protein HC890_11250 [Chloroflexaceae bacterium]|nr:hypothetical protein [Chloroflexaceae bacterium]